MISIIRRDLRDQRIAIAAYCAIGVFIIVLYIMLFPSIRDASAQLEKLFDAYPKSLFKAFGIEKLTFDTIEKFLALELFSFTWPIIAIIFAMSRAGRSVAGEIEKGTIGLYLSLPLKRTQIYFARYLSNLAAVGIFVLLTVTSILPLAAAFNLPAAPKPVLYASLFSLLFAWSLMSISMFFSALFSERSKVYIVVGGGLLFMYVLNVVAGLKENFSWLYNYTIFHYFNVTEILSTNTIHMSYAWVFVVSIFLSAVLGAIYFSRRDIIA